MIVLTLSLLFLLSLLGAYSLLEFPRAPAIIQTCTYRTGGAIGGFVSVSAMFFGSYQKIASPGSTTMGKAGPKLADARIVPAVGKAIHSDLTRRPEFNRPSSSRLFPLWTVRVKASRACQGYQAANKPDSSGKERSASHA